MAQAYAYILHLLSGFVLVAVFFFIYTKVTPFEEIKLIHEGNTAALCSLAGAVIGFSLTVASSILHNDLFLVFLLWAIGAMIVQVLTYWAVTKLLPQMNQAIHDNNFAMGGLMGVIALVVGVISAACLS